MKEREKKTHAHMPLFPYFGSFRHGIDNGEISKAIIDFENVYISMRSISQYKHL